MAMNNHYLNRRQFMLLTGATMYAAYGHTNTNKTTSLLVTNNDIAITLQWLQHMRDSQSGLLYYMDKGVAHFLSPLATAKTAIWAAKLGQTGLLQQCAKALVTAQQQLAKQHTHLAGALASSYQNTPKGLEAGQYVYACEQLVAIYAWLEAAQHLNDNSWVKYAQQNAKFLQKTFFNGKALGIWQQAYPVPFNYLTTANAYENTMRNGVEFLWIVALERLYQATGEPQWHQMYQDALGFYLQSQADNGLWFDTFYPDKKQWAWFSKENVVADNMLRCAIAAKLNHQDTQVAQFLSLIEPKQHYYLAGYLSTHTGKSGFIVNDPPYFDIVSTALLRNLYSLLGNVQQAEQCQRALAGLKPKQGGYYWGRYMQSLKPVADEKAVITTLWASANLSPTFQPLVNKQHKGAKTT